MKKLKHTLRRGFTLIELLVVVAIIALLISILVPSLAGARHQAKTVVCASKVRQLSLAMVLYATEWQNSVVGNGNTSGIRTYKIMQTSGPFLANQDCPDIITSFDIMGPMALQMKLQFERGNTPAQRLTRFYQLNSNPNFLCPENDILGGAYAGPNGAPVTNKPYPVPSYNTSFLFQVKYVGGGADNVGTQGFINTGNYAPKVGSVGNPSTKIFVSDGGRWSNGAGVAITINLDAVNTTGGSPGGAFADYGPYDAFSRSFLPGNLNIPMRHGKRGSNLSEAAYKMNAGFFDGHVDTLDGLKAMDPNLWAPTGTLMDQSEAVPVAKAKYWPTSTITIR